MPEILSRGVLQKVEIAKLCRRRVIFSNLARRLKAECMSPDRREEMGDGATSSKGNLNLKGLTKLEGAD